MPNSTTPPAGARVQANEPLDLLGLKSRVTRRLMLQQMIDASQTSVNGVVRLKLYKGNVIVTGRKSDDSLFDANIATFEEDGGAYNQADAAGFIKLNALRMRIAANKGRKLF